MLAVASARLLAVQRSSLARRPLLGRSLDIGFAIAVATARPASSRCRHSHRGHFSRRARLPAPACHCRSTLANVDIKVLESSEPSLLTGTSTRRSAIVWSLQPLKSLSTFNQTAKWWRRLSMPTNSKCLLGILKMLEQSRSSHQLAWQE